MEALRVNDVRVAASRYSDLAGWCWAAFGWGALDMAPLAPSAPYRQGFVPLPRLTGFELYCDIAPTHSYRAVLASAPIAYAGWALRTDDIDAIA